MVVEPGRLVELQVGSDSWFVHCKWCAEEKYFSLDRQHGGAEAAKQHMEGLSWRLSMPGRSSKLRWWSCPVCAKEYEWPEEIVSITPQVGAISHAALPAHAIEGGPLARGPASGGESWSRRGDPSAQQARTPLFAGGMGETSPEHVLNWRPRRNDLIFPDTRASGGVQVAAVIDELQAEVRKLKDVVAELRAEVDELKVRGARDEKDIVWVMEEIIGQRPPHVNIPTSGG